MSDNDPGMALYEELYTGPHDGPDEPLQCDVRNISRYIIEYENGEMTHEEVVKFFQLLLDTGTLWHLQGSYQRTAAYLLAGGEIG